MSKASKKRRRAERAARTVVNQFGFGRVLTEDKPKGFGCPQCGRHNHFDRLTLTMILTGLPCCGYVLSQHSEVNQVVRDRAEYKASIDLEQSDERTRKYHRSQPKYDNGGDF